MLKNYLTVAVRNLFKQKFYAGLNILGLAIGLASCLLILLYVTDELSYDQFHERAAEIHRVNWDYNWNGNEGIGPGTPPPLAARMAEDIPGINATTRIYPVADLVARHEDTFFKENQIFGVDPNFFEVFSFDLLEGHRETALAEPGSVILTQETARKYFDEGPALGQTLTLGEDDTFADRPYTSTFTVTGIVQNPPPNSHFDFDILTSMASHPQVAYFDWSWIWMQVVTYAVVDPVASIEEIEAGLVEMVGTHAPQAFDRIGFSFSDLIAGGGRWNFVLQPLTDIYLGSSDIGNRLGPLGNRAYLYIFSIVAIFILLIACINFMNLATAQSAKRAKEVGVRKALGAVRRDLMGQFMTEAMLFSLFAMLLAIGLAEAFLSPFEGLSGKALSLNLLESGWLLLALVALTLGVGFLAGSYPSLYLSAFKPILVLKGKLLSSSKSQRFRNGLVIFQFAISIALIASTLLVQNQMQFLREADVGFDKEGVLIISNENDLLGGQAETYRDLIKSSPRVLNAALSTGVPPGSLFQDYYQAEDKGIELFELTSYLVDDDFVVTLGLEMVQGQGFSEDYPSSRDGVILNESAVQLFGWEAPLGKTITYPSAGTYQVIGVMRDFNFMTLREPVMPFALFHRAAEPYTIPRSFIVVRLQAEDLPGTLQLLEDQWKTLAPGVPFDYAFLDATLQTQYEAEQRLQAVFSTFTGLAILIACMGLLGLAAFTAERRTKEIGVRKVLGASVPRVILLLTKDFTRWVLAANLIAWPLAWFGMTQWLQNFAYHVEISWGVFLLAGLAALAVALVTVSYQALKAALANPIDALRYE